MRTWCSGAALAVLASACSVNEAGNIPCHDSSHCPGEYPTCSGAGYCVAGAPAAHLEVVSGDAQSAVVGTALAQPLVVKVTDTNGNAVAGFAVTWAVAAGSGQVSTATANTGPDGKLSTTATLGTAAGANAFAATASGLSGSPATFSATGIPDVAVALALAAPDSTTAGDAQPFTVTAKDQYGNVASGYRGTIHFTSSDGAAALPPDYTFVATDAGAHTFAVTLKTASTSASIAATDTASAAIQGNRSGIAVNPGLTSKLLVTGFPNPASADTGGSVTVKAVDANDNVTPAYRGTVSFASDDLNHALPASYTFQASDNGVHTFNGVILKTASPPSHLITATDTVTVTISGSQSGIVVDPGTTAKLRVAGFPNPVIGGTPGSLTVTALDANDNPTPAYRGTVQFTSTNTSKSLPADYAFTSGDAGAHTFSNVILNTTSASSSISATDTVTATITGTQSGIVVNAGPLLFGSTATVISGGTRDGLIFVAGGNNNSLGTGTAFSNTWFYDPANSSLTAGPPLAFARSFHTATAIGGGQVLLAGGASTGAGFREFELCSLDGSATCATSGALTTPRCNAAAALLTASPARVLVAGGDDCAGGAALDTWVVWNNGTLSSSGGGNRLSAGRHVFTATALSSGKALLAGGAATATADVFTVDTSNASNSTVAATSGAMQVARSGHTATFLPAGTTACPTLSVACVLIAGGNSTAGKTWEIYDVGGASGDTFPRNATTAGHDLVNPQRSLHAAALFADGRVLLAGGFDGTNPLSTTEIFDPAAGTLTFSSGTALLQTRFEMAAAHAAAQNVLVLIGGNRAGPSTEQAATP